MAYMSQQIVPPPAIVRLFDKIAVPIYTNMYQNNIEARTLADIRDTLLPKLISGELDVSDLDINVGDTSA